MSTTFIGSISDSTRIETINRFLQMSNDVSGTSMDCPFSFPNIEAVRRCKKVVVTGPVGVGKTTILSEICKHLDGKLNYRIVPEYIDVLPDATEKLAKYLKGELSSYNFQRYVSVYYIQYLERIAKDVTEDTVLIFERVPDDALWCFIRMDQMKGLITPREHQHLSQLIARMNEYFNLPCYTKTNNQSALIIKSDELAINAKIAADFIKDSSHAKIVIGLFNDVKICYDRVLKRARPGEDSYNFNGIFMFNQCYANMYKNLMFA
jgi:deoxyadenosine/deoxycytidine kinase